MANTTSSIHETEAPTSSPSCGGADLKAKAQDIKETAKDAALHLKDQAKDMASTVGHKAEEATASVGCGMKSLAGTIRETAPHSGMAGRVSESLAESLESGGRYLQEEGLSGLGEDMSELIRTYPIPSVLVGIGIGFLLARVTRS